MTASFLSLIFAPRLYRLYHRNLGESGGAYNANFAERWGDFFISYGLPIGGIYCVWQRKLNYVIYLGILVASSYVLRAAGRAVNPTYLQFLEVLSRVKQSLSTENLELIRKYDFEFTSWPVTYKCSNLSLHARTATGGREFSASWLIGWLVAHSFGIRLIYPGLLFGPIIRAPLEEARSKYVIEKGGVRHRVQSADNNSIDTMLFDRRNDATPNGKTLVICCEGNAGFYEIGMISTPIELGYSILGWNHPGFGGSTGVPYPKTELNAAEAVFDFATKELGFKEENILIYGWSIGGFPASHLARSHPNIKGLILDATFDDIMPLALPRMPVILSPVVQWTIRHHVNLQVSQELAGYPGPIRVIRRTEDEIIADPPGELKSNRGNYLLKDLIEQRFPELMDNPESAKALDDWIGKSHARDTTSVVAVLLAQSDFVIPENLDELSIEAKKQLVVKIADHYLSDFKSSHCTQLPSSLFQIPWSHSPRPVPSSSIESQLKQKAQ
ncbi:unnamed protein product [Allacma fusca]|uniref:AB hydrolase-1 domain-containing protein n=1 Tax=Allacma fusca TaxID=39272 RepID=A0A8J2L5T7_9HEXA|nr:unnamed protein product [Allacma fusca]